ncbi:MAG: S9 family peptidase [Proteobacteria bacterium]|nr:S9 family peptidase [Pseudomonadota bacterium]
MSSRPFIILTLILLGHTGTAAGQGEPLTLEDIVTLKRVASAVMSPDGEHIAYVLNVPRTPYVDENGSAYRELHITDLEGNSRGFITGEVSIGQIAWSADGETVYYLAERNDDDEFRALYGIPVAGGESQRLYSHDANIQSFQPSPDGRHIGFLATDGDPSEREQLANLGFRAVVYGESRRSTRAWVLDLEAEEPEAVAADLPGSASDFRWAPGGERYLVALAPTPSVDDSLMRRRFHIVDAQSGEVLNLFETEGKLGDVTWSPDGRQVAYVGAVDLNDPSAGQIFVAAADGEGIRALTPSYPGHVDELEWRDADSLWYSGSRGLWNEIGILAADGTSVLSAQPEGDPIARSFDAVPGSETVAVIADTPEHPGEVYVWSETDGYRRLTHSNPGLEDRPLAAQEAVTYTARDGLEIEGVLVRPLESEPGERHPLILVIHGGPEAHYSHGWMSGYSAPAQTLAARGYALFYPNYRASTGRGVEFSKLDHYDPAGKEFDDIVDAKAHLVDIGLVDPDRVGITCGSNGGYAKMWGSTALSEHFAAGVAFVGISNLVSKFVSGDIPRELYEVHTRFWPWDDWQLTLERSPIFHAGNSRTPLLILGGDSDTRVNPSQSLQLYQTLKLRTDTPVRLVIYPGEGHGNSRTAAQLDYAMRMTRWMDHYLMGPGGEAPPYELDHAERLADMNGNDE